MNAKDKAIELVDKYSFLKEIFSPSITEQKTCALVAVNEILSHDLWLFESNYWREVKQEINKL
jgi:hypothetical protein